MHAPLPPGIPWGFVEAPVLGMVAFAHIGMPPSWPAKKKAEHAGRLHRGKPEVPCWRARYAARSIPTAKLVARAEKMCHCRRAAAVWTDTRPVDCDG